MLTYTGVIGALYTSDDASDVPDPGAELPHLILLPLCSLLGTPPDEVKAHILLRRVSGRRQVWRSANDSHGHLDDCLVPVCQSSIAPEAGGYAKLARLETCLTCDCS